MATEERPSTFQVSVKHGEVAAHVWGRGPALLIALHGFALPADEFATWVPLLGNRYTICAPDLPFHGQTVWRKPFFTPTDMLK
ncbi:MAG: hypothetical protein R2795_09555 [Saprospiraceae bacterium]